ncbi:MAG: transglycosylase SLT domain-containing protein [Deltaproteobacteria bacterium]|nr:transglycosylase SLT domain-containing protein [Deltaproteobacteria bacterium]
MNRRHSLSYCVQPSISQSLKIPAGRWALGSLVILSALLVSAGATQAEDPKKSAQLFPSSPVIDRQKAFWIKAFTEMDPNTAVIHDGLMTVPVFEVVSIPDDRPRVLRRQMKERLDALRKLLHQTADAMDAGADPGPEGKRLIALYGQEATPQRLRGSAENLRFQRGLSKMFEQGLIRSGAYLDRMKAIFREENLPEDLAYLPHVESSFNFKAYSKVGAAGAWQFMPATGKRFMSVRYEVDERLDPLLATRAAAGLMRENHQHMKNWPLAITAYNHGWQNLEKIVARTGTSDLGQLILHYDGPYFKFASKNFYSEFLAAREVAMNSDRHFKGVTVHEPFRFQEVELPFYLEFAQAAKVAGVKPDVLADMNPALRPPVVIGTKYIPQGYKLRIPAEVTLNAFMGALPPEQRHDKQKPMVEWVVGRGDTLFGLGQRFGVPWQVLAQANNMSTRHRLRPGQRIVIPPPGDKIALAAKAGIKPPSAQVMAASITRSISTPIKAVSAPPAAQDKVAFQEAEGRSQFQDLDLHDFDPATREGEIIVAYGETVGNYATWAHSTVGRIQAVNGLGRRGRGLQPGRPVTIPLNVEPQEFNQQRAEFHRQREEDFFSSYAVSETTEVKLAPGETVWSLAQSNNVPMWLFYQNNPDLVGKAVQPGTLVKLPVIEEVVSVGGVGKD